MQLIYEKIEKKLSRSPYSLSVNAWVVRIIEQKILQT